MDAYIHTHMETCSECIHGGYIHRRRYEYIQIYVTPLEADEEAVLV